MNGRSRRDFVLAGKRRCLAAFVPHPTVRPGNTGTAAVELALVFPVVLLLVFGIIAFAVFGWTVVSLQYAAEAAGRCAALNAACDVRATVLAKAAGIWTPVTVTYNANDRCGTPSLPCSTVSVTGTCRFFPVALLPYSVPLNIVSHRPIARSS